MAEPADARLGHGLERPRLRELHRVGEAEAVGVEVGHARPRLVEVAIESEAQADVGHRVGVDGCGGEQRRRQQRPGGEQEHERPVRREAPQREPPDGEELAHADSLGVTRRHGHGRVRAARAASEAIRP